MLTGLFLEYSRVVGNFQDGGRKKLKTVKYNKFDISTSNCPILTNLTSYDMFSDMPNAIQLQLDT